MKNYALITKGIEDLLLESYETKDKDNINKLLKELKNNSKLKTLFSIVDNLKSGDIPPHKVDAFIKENINIARKIDFSEFDSLIDDNVETTELLESIGIILFNEKNAINISEHYRAYDVVKKNLNENLKYKEEYENKLAEYSEKYIKLDVEDKALFEQFFTTNSNGRKKVFESLVTECTDLLNEKISEVDDLQVKLKLYETKEIISSCKYNTEDYAEKMTMIHELKKDISNS